jgi:molybdopterin-guanine dinucleotide biosynthesis protein A
MNLVQKNISGIILAGGQGQRFDGADKGLLLLDGKPLVAHVANTLLPQVSTVTISANRNLDSYRALGYAVVEDLRGPFLGPLAGIAAALATITTELALVVPCDTPFLPHDLGQRLYAALQHHQADIAIAHDGQRLQPMCVLLRRKLLDSLNAELAVGHLKVQKWMLEQRHCIVDFSDEARCFMNINSADDLTKAAATLG